MLPKLGERAVTSLEVKHPTLAILLPIITQRLTTTLNRGWWFNEYVYTAYPDNDKHIYLGDDTISFLPDESDVAVLRGNQLFNPVALTYEFDGPIKGTVIQTLDFDLLPETAANYIFYSSLVDAYTTDLGVTQELQIWQNASIQSWSDLLSEHLKNRRYSTKRTGKWLRYVRALQG